MTANHVLGLWLGERGDGKGMCDVRWNRVLSELGLFYFTSHITTTTSLRKNDFTCLRELAEVSRGGEETRCM